MTAQSRLHAETTAEKKASDQVLRKILVGIDFSATSRAALNIAEDLAQIYGSEMILAHVINAVNASSPDAGEVFTTSDLGHAMSEDLDRLSKQINETGISSRAVLLEGSVTSAIEEMVLSHKPDLIVLGTHGAHNIERLILGSTAEAILRFVSCPVMTIGPRCASTPVKPTGFQTILYATALSPRVESALCYAAAFAGSAKTHIELVHAVEQIDAKSIHDIESGFLEQEKVLAAQLKDSTSKVTSHLVYGEPVEAIIDRARKSEADLLILEVHRRKQFRFFRPESTAYRITIRLNDPIASKRCFSTELDQMSP
ncbi:MAG: universal stress protein [Acidobacteriaceae bacterium]